MPINRAYDLHAPGISGGHHGGRVLRDEACPWENILSVVRRSVLVALVLVGYVATGGCASMPDGDLILEEFETPKDAESLVDEKQSHPPEAAQAMAPKPPPFSIEDRMALGSGPGLGLPEKSPVKTFSFRAEEMLLVDALRLFARVNDLNIVMGPNIVGSVTVDFQGLALEHAMTALLDAHGYYWAKEGELIVVRRLESRSFTIDYIRLERSGTGLNKAQVTSGGGGGSGQDAGEVTLSQNDQVKFWAEIEMQVKTLLSPDGRLVINRLSGTIQVTDLHRRVEEVAHFIADIRQSLYRQVEIQARIYEIALNDDYSLGLNWDRINFKGSAGAITLTNIVGTPAGGFLARAATAALSFSEGSFDGVIEALREQGEVKVVSQPRILTLNNQPALIKVGTDQSFFTSTTTIGTVNTGNTVTEQIRTVTEGLVLSVTPQISQDGWVMMDVSPIITRLARIVESPNGSTAPVLDVKQSGGLVRVRDGEMVIIGGLIQDKASNKERSVPLLGDIPWFGRLFKGSYQAKSKTELVIFLVPRIIEVK